MALLHAFLAAALAASSLGPQGVDRIAYSCLTGDHWQIWVMEGLDAPPTQFTSGRSDKRYPTWSGDGSFLVFGDTEGRLFRAPASGGEHVQLMSDQGALTEPTLSQSDRLAYLRVRQMPGYLVEVWSSDLDGSNRLLHTRAPLRQLQPSWSPDGRALAVAQYDPTADVHSLSVIKADGAEAVPWLAGKARISSPAFAPDGARIAFALDFEGNNEICVVRRGETVPTRLTHDPALDAAPVWSADGRRLLFVSRRSGSLQLWAMNDDGSSIQRVTVGDAPCREPAWTRPKTSGGLSVSAARLTHRALDPRAAAASVEFEIDTAATITVELEGLSSGVVVSTPTDLERGRHVLELPRKNELGDALPNDVYLVRLRARAGDAFGLWDPSAHTGGDIVSVQDLALVDEQRAASFVAPSLCWVRARFGLSAGPLLATPIDWVAYGPGAASISFDGALAVGWGNYWDHADRHVWIAAYSLPDNAVLYQEQSARVPHSSLRKPLALPPGGTPFPHARHAPRACRDPKVKVALVDPLRVGADGVPVVSDFATLVVDAADDATRELLESSRFEVVIWVDGNFLMEDEDSALPFHFKLSTNLFPAGDHAFLVNVGGYEDHLGAAFAPFRVETAIR